MTARKQSKSKSKTPRPATRAAPTREVEASTVEVQDKALLVLLRAQTGHDC